MTTMDEQYAQLQRDAQAIYEGPPGQDFTPLPADQQLDDTERLIKAYADDIHHLQKRVETLERQNAGLRSSWEARLALEDELNEERERRQRFQLEALRERKWRRERLRLLARYLDVEPRRTP